MRRERVRGPLQNARGQRGINRRLAEPPLRYQNPIAGIEGGETGGLLLEVRQKLSEWRGTRGHGEIRLPREGRKPQRELDTPAPVIAGGVS